MLNKSFSSSMLLFKYFTIYDTKFLQVQLKAELEGVDFLLKYFSFLIKSFKDGGGGGGGGESNLIGSVLSINSNFPCEIFLILSKIIF